MIDDEDCLKLSSKKYNGQESSESNSYEEEDLESEDIPSETESVHAIELPNDTFKPKASIDNKASPKK